MQPWLKFTATTMPNHPNRGRRSAASSPTPEQVLAARKAAGLTQSQAAELVHATRRAWQLWESGDRRMHPAFFELFEHKKPCRGQG